MNIADDIVHRNIQLGNFIQLQIYPHGLFLRTPVLDLLKGFQFFELLFQFFRIELHFFIGGILGDQRDLHYVYISGRDLLDFYFVDVLRKACPQAVHFTHQLLVFCIYIGTILVFHLQYGNAIVDIGFDFLDIVELSNFFLDGFHYKFFHVLWAGAGIYNNDGELGRVEFGIFGPGHIHHCGDRHHHDHQEQHQG